MFGIASDKQFEILKLRSRETGIDIDERIKLVVEVINSLPGFATVWSCSGHTNDEYRSRGQDKTSDFIDNSHVIFVINEQGFNQLEKISNALLSFIETSNKNGPRPVLSQIYLKWVFDNEGMFEWYPVWKLSIAGNFNNSRFFTHAENFWRHFVNHLEEDKKNY